MTKNKSGEEIVEEINEEAEAESTIKVLEEEDLVKVADKKAEEYKDLAQRVQAEFDNYRKRNNESVKLSRNDGINDVITAILPSVDNLERGIGTVSDEAAKTGMNLILKQLQELLKKFEVEEIKALGEKFDPDMHHAVSQEENIEKQNTVTEVYAKGYQRKNKVLRPSMVKVAI